MSFDEASWSMRTRHARVWLDPSAWRLHVRSVHEPDDIATVDRWVVQGRPLVARRRTDDRIDDAWLGLALPLAHARRRIALVVDGPAVVRVSAPLLLDEALAAAPAAWRSALHGLAVAGRRLDTRFHLYGSLAWQVHAGEPCMTDDSDVDLLWSARSPAQMRAVLDLLSACEQASGIRLDGEALFDDGGAVAWRELLGSHPHVLSKSDRDVRLRAHPLMAPAS